MRPPDRPERQGTRVASVSPALRVLETFAGHPEGPCPATAAAPAHREAGLARIPATLERLGLVGQDAVTAPSAVGLVRVDGAALEGARPDSGS